MSVPNPAGTGPSLPRTQEFDLTPAARLDPRFVLQRKIPLIVLKWYVPTFALVGLLIYLGWRAGSLAPAPGFIPFLVLAGGAVVWVGFAAYLLIRGPRLRRLPVRLSLEPGGLEFACEDGERHRLGWKDRGLWLDVSHPSGPKIWDQRLGEILVDTAGGPTKTAARQRRLFGGAVPGPMLRYDGKEVVLTESAFSAVLDGARSAGCRITKFDENSWDGWLIQEPLEGRRVWAD